MPNAPAAAADVFVVAITQGPDAGARLVVTRSATKVIGRSRSADLVVSDRGISRAHIELSVAEGKLVVRCLPGTAPVVVNGGINVDHASLNIGDAFVLSDTAFAILPSAVDVTSISNTAQATELRGLLQGLAADVKSLRSIAELVEALDAATDPASIATVLDAWSKANAGAKQSTLLGASDLRGNPELGSLYEAHGAVLTIPRADGGNVSIAIAAHGSTPHALVIDVPGTPDRITPETLRLLGVAGRIAGSALHRVEQRQSLEADVASLRTLALGSAREFLGTSPAAKEVSRLLQRLAATDATALIVGESGTGKSFVARLVHEASKRNKEPFRVINCAAIPENLLESELFGHERGAFSGAVAAHAGAFEAAGRGTILLDEIGELALPSQAKLLRVLEERKFERVGSNKTLTVDARILAATNRDLPAMVKAGQFRQDLFFRISVVSVRVPPLRDRGDDVILLAQQLLADGLASAGRRVTGFTPQAIATIRKYPWPGNVRELRNAVEHALVLGDTAQITPSDLPETMRATAAATAATGQELSTASVSTSDDPDVVKLPAKLDWLEEKAIQAALRATGGNRAKAAAILGINRVTLYKKLRAEDQGDPEQ